MPTIAINDAQAAAWAEYQALDGDITDMVFITVSTGVGGGVVSGGKLRTGPGGLAGHIGHTLADPHGPVCGCGRTGCVEASTGVGGGVVSGGKLRTGPGGLAGHIGHTLADPHGPVCGCGRTGCVEAIASGRGIAAAAQGELAGANAKTIFTRAGQGDEQA